MVPAPEQAAVDPDTHLSPSGAQQFSGHRARAGRAMLDVDDRSREVRGSSATIFRHIPNPPCDAATTTTSNPA